GGDDHLHELVAIWHRPAVVLRDDIAGLDAALLSRAARQHPSDDRSRARLQAEILVAFTRHRRDRDADAAAYHLAFTQLRQQIAHGVDGHGEADADVAFGSAVADDGRVDPDHFAADVQQRSAGIARIDR